MIDLVCEVAEVDPSIIASMKARLNPAMQKSFSYANNDHLKAAEENEKKMREKHGKK